MKQLKKCKRPGAPTVKGEAVAIVKAKAYQRLLDIAASADAQRKVSVRAFGTPRNVERGRREFFSPTLRRSMAYLVNSHSNAG
jgi:hypothetical protein